jgi:lipopolysaccharide/colanic/teichoic acid biosynthesis glycosyltransferase
MSISTVEPTSANPLPFPLDTIGTSRPDFGTSTRPVPHRRADLPADTPRERLQADPVDAPSAPAAWTVAPDGNLTATYRLLKRLIDVVGALALLTVLGPFLLVTFLILLVTTRGKPLFWQRRAGYCGRPFLMFKFRTMVADAERRQHEVDNEQQGPVFKNRRDPRITRIGRVLRKTSLDEAPQLFHVLLGRMSLVGPRPLPLHEVAQFTPQQRRRLAVMPGLTCLWQVSGRSNIEFDRWMQLDLWYVRNQGLGTDLKLLWRTPMTVLSGRGAY